METEQVPTHPMGWIDSVSILLIDVVLQYNTLLAASHGYRIDCCVSSKFY